MNSQILAGLLRTLKGFPQNVGSSAHRVVFMDNSPSRRIVLPVLLASIVGLTAFLWPLAFTHSKGMSQKLSSPLSQWVKPALIPSQPKEFSVRYIGFALLSSAAIGVGTARAMDQRQRGVHRHQQLLEQVLTALNTPQALSSEEASPSHDLVNELSDWAAGKVPAPADSTALAPLPLGHPERPSGVRAQ